MDVVPILATPVDICRSRHLRASLCIERLGGLTYTRGAHLHSPPKLDGVEQPFAGLSALTLSPIDQTKLLAITDLGWWVQLPRRPRLGVHNNVTMTPILGPDGMPVGAHGKASADAEGLTHLPPSTSNGSGLLVSFERRHRVRRYDFDGDVPGRAQLFDNGALDAALSECTGGGGNHGVEALEMINSTHLLVVCESAESGATGSAPAFILDLSVTTVGGAFDLRRTR